MQTARTFAASCASGQSVEVNDDVTERPPGDPLLARPPGDGLAGVDTDALFRDHRVRLTRLAAAITFDRLQAEEVVQDAFLGLQRRGRDVADSVGYLQRSVVNLSISVLRRRRTAASYLVPPAPHAVNPEIDETWSAVGRLPGRERAVVVLRYWLDLSEADIAAWLDWPVGTVKSTLHRAIQRLRKDLPS